MTDKHGAILKACRERAGFTQEEMAERVNYDRSIISRLETDKQPVSLATFLKWVQETGSQEVAVAFFCGMDGLSIMQSIIDMGTGVINLLMVALEGGI